jgi:uncharacterized protein (TIGR02001 family)
MKQANRYRGRSGTLKTAFAAAACSVLLAFGATAAEDVPPGEEGTDKETGVKVGGFTINTNTELLSDWVSNGYTQTNGSPAIQGEFIIGRRDFYAKAWASSMKLFDDVTGVTLYSEIDLTFGYEKTEKDFTVTAEGVYVTYPDSDNPFYDYDYWEYKAGIAYQFTKRFKAGVALRYSPDYSGEVGPNWIVEGAAECELPKVRIFTPAITGEIAWQDGDETEGGVDYGWWNAGLELGFAKHYKLDFRYHNTISADDCEGECGSRFTTSVKAEF